MTKIIDIINYMLLIFVKRDFYARFALYASASADVYIFDNNL